jgi:hypothetical protein
VAIISGVTATYAEGSLAGADAWVGQSGSITIDELTDTGASGSFSFQARNNSGDTVSVTDGSFDVTF